MILVNDMKCQEPEWRSVFSALLRNDVVCVAPGYGMT